MKQLEPVSFEEVKTAIRLLDEVIDGAAENDPAANVFMPDEWEYPAALALVTYLRNSRAFEAAEALAISREQGSAR